MPLAKFISTKMLPPSSLLQISLWAHLCCFCEFWCLAVAHLRLYPSGFLLKKYHGWTFWTPLPFWTGYACHCCYWGYGSLSWEELSWELWHNSFHHIQYSLPAYQLSLSLPPSSLYSVLENQVCFKISKFPLHTVIFQQTVSRTVVVAFMVTFTTKNRHFACHGLSFCSRVPW